MKRKHDFFCIFAVVAFMLVFHHVLLCGQTSGVKPGISFMRIAKTSDVLYTNDSTYFLMNRSPLEKFSDYKKLYEKYKDKMVEHVDGFFYGAAIRPDKTTNYSAIWYLNDSLLYLSDIDFFLLVDKVENIFPNNEQYKLMEELTGSKFDTIYENHTRYTYKEHKHDRSIINKLINPFGAMPATWFSDTLIVKMVAKYKESLAEWEKEPCRELIFEKGRLISDRIKEEMSQSSE